MKIQIKSYIFDASARTITFSDYEAIDIDSVLYIIHVTDNRAIYNPMNKNLKGSVFGNVLTLNYDTSTMSDTDELQIYYDKIPDPATEAKQQLIIDAISEITLDTSLLATEETLQAVAGLNIPKFDYVAGVETNATTETYTFKTGGSGGTTVATVVVVFSDSDKTFINSITKS